MKNILLNAFNSFDLTKPRLTKGIEWFNGFTISEIDRDYKVCLTNGNASKCLEWQVIKNENDRIVNEVLQGDKTDQEMLSLYKILVNFYYNHKGTAFLTELEESLES